MKSDFEKMMIQHWGTPKQYYTELENFLKRHQDADAQIYHTELGALMYVRYNFKPFTVIRDNVQLMEAIRKEIHGK